MRELTDQARFVELEEVLWEDLRPGDTVWVAGDAGKSTEGPYGVYSLGDRSLLTLAGEVVNKNGAQLLKAKKGEME